MELRRTALITAKREFIQTDQVEKVIAMAATGRIKFYSEKGLGFLTGDDEVDYFFHIKDVAGRRPPYAPGPVRGAPCDFLPSQGKRGPVAKEVKIDRPAVTAEAESAFRRIADWRGE